MINKLITIYLFSHQGRTFVTSAHITRCQVVLPLITVCVLRKKGGLRGGASGGDSIPSRLHLHLLGEELQMDATPGCPSRHAMGAPRHGQWQ